MSARINFVISVTGAVLVVIFFSLGIAAGMTKHTVSVQSIRVIPSS